MWKDEVNRHLELKREDPLQWLGMLETIVDGSTNMVVVTDAQRRITWVNATYTRFTGWTLEECAGKRPRELLHGPKTDAQALAELAGLLKQGRSIAGYELLNYKKSGEPYYVALNIEPIRDADGAVVAYLSIQSDVTERRQVAQRTQELMQRLEVAQRLARLGRIERDVTSGQFRWSSEIFRIVGMEPDEAPRGFSALLALAEMGDGDHVDQALPDLIAQGGEIDLEFRVVGLHGGRRWVRCRGVPEAVEGGHQTPESWSVQDITLYKRSLEEKRLRNEVLDQLVQERTRKLEESNRALEEFSYALSHDLRTPLRHMAGFAELIKGDLVSGAGAIEVCTQHCEKVIQASKKMQSLIEGLLSFARLGRDGLKIEPVNLSELLSEISTGLQVDAAPRQVAWRIASGFPVIQADPVLAREVVVNLLENALKYSSHREISEVEVGWGSHAQGWLFFVRDNGIGFEPAQAEKLFGMFQRLHRDSRFSGEGIGLALVRRIVECHGGRIWATALPNQGATFCILLPKEAGQQGVAYDNCHSMPDELVAMTMPGLRDT